MGILFEKQEEEILTTLSRIVATAGSANPPSPDAVDQLKRDILGVLNDARGRVGDAVTDLICLTEERDKLREELLDCYRELNALRRDG